MSRLFRDLDTLLSLPPWLSPDGTGPKGYRVAAAREALAASLRRGSLPMASAPPAAPPSPADWIDLWDTEEQLILMPATAGQILPADPRRVAVAFHGGSVVGSFVVSTRPGLDMATGYPVPASGDPLLFRWDDYGPLVSRAWYGLASVPGGSIPVVTIVYRKRG